MALVEHYHLVRTNGERIRPGEPVTLHNGGTGIYDGVAQAPDAGSTGKILVRVNNGVRAPELRTFFPGVVGAELVEVPRDAA